MTRARIVALAAAYVAACWLLIPWLVERAMTP